MLRKRLQALLSVLSVLLVLALLAAAFLWWQVRRSLPQLDGSAALPGLTAAVTIERDAQGVPTVTGASRADVARATGFLHAQDRFFQMDLLRRRAAGELAALFGPAAVEVDKSARLHGFRRLAGQVLAGLPAEHRALLDAYTAGVNAGRAALAQKPWEYLVLRLDPVDWKPEDSLLCVFAMWFDLQDYTGDYERSLQALRLAHGSEVLAFLAPIGDSHDAALDGSTFPAPPLPGIRLKAAEPATTATTAALADEPDDFPGSNSFALDGRHTASGAALLANDMHLNLAVPHIWYRAALRWRDPTGTDWRLAGVTLPGTPFLVAGSNGHLAWGFTNSYIDTADVVTIETDAEANILYRTPTGWKEIEERAETIEVKGEPAVAFTARWCEWGPLLEAPIDGRALALRWTAHDLASHNLRLAELETTATVPAAVALAPHLGIPNQNLLVADREGRTAWTLTGTIPQRTGFDGRLPVSWAYGDRRWTGWLPDAQRPLVSSRPLGLPAGSPAETVLADGYLWTANQRLVGGEALARLGDGGYSHGFRAGAIRDDLRDLVASGRKATAADLHAVMLDDRGRYLERWKGLLLEVLTDDAVAQRAGRAALRDAVRAWQGHASTDSAGYRLLRAYRLFVISRATAPFLPRSQANYAGFSFGKLHTEDAVWRLVTEKPARLLNPSQPSWDALLLGAADDVLAEAAKAGVEPDRFTWGARNTLRIQHPFSRFLPAPVARFIDMPAEAVPGDSNLPRVQGPRFGQSERMVVSPGREDEGIFTQPGGPSGHPLSPFYRAGHDDWVRAKPAPFLPGPAQHKLTLNP